MAVLVRVFHGQTVNYPTPESESVERSSTNTTEDLTESSGIKLR